MNKFPSIKTSLAAISVVVAMSALAAPAQAACQNSVWSKIGGTSFASTIKGRQCGSNMAVRMSGSFGNTGWLSMQNGGSNKLRATFVDNNITTKIKMTLLGQQMVVHFEHIANDGAVSFTSGDYNLVSYQ